MSPPVPVGTPADIAFGMAVVSIGAAALVIMGNGFQAGSAKKEKNGFGLPGASNARRARDKDGKPTQSPPKDSNDNDNDQ